MSNHTGMAEAAHWHFVDILGTIEERAFTLDLGEIHVGHFDLSGLDRPFTEEEIWAAVKSLSSGKASGPDGFTSEFVRSAWEVIKHDICGVFGKLYSLNSRGFHNLNEALITLLPKKPDVE